MTKPIFAQKALLLARLNSTSSNNAVPTNDAHTVPVSNLSVQPIKADFISQNLLRPFLGTLPEIISSPYAEISFDVVMPVPLSRSETAPWKDLLIACGFIKQPTPEPNYYATYTPGNDVTPDMNFHYYIGGNLFAINRARGNCVLLLEAGELPLLRFRFIGEHANTSSRNLPVAHPERWENILPVSPQNTTITINSQSDLNVRRFSMNLGNSIRLVKRINANFVVIESRKPTGSVLFDQTGFDTFDPFAITLQQHLSTVQIVHGDANRHNWLFHAPYVQIIEPVIEQDSNLSIVRASLAFHQKAPSQPQLPEMRFATK